MPTKRVLLVAKYPLLLAGLRKIIENSGEFEVAAEVTGVEAVIRQCRIYIPDLILVDFDTVKKDGFDFVLKIKRICPATKVLALNIHCDQRLPEKALQEEVDGFIHKDTGREGLLQAMHEVFCGRGLVGRNLSGRSWRPARWKERSFDSLTCREKEILQLVAQGLTNRQIADALYVSGHTVGNHCTNIRTKLGLNSKQAITAYAFRSGLVQ